MVAFWDMSNALQAADRVVFVGPQSGHVSKLREGELRKRLFEFQTTYQAAEYMKLQTLPGELISLMLDVVIAEVKTNEPCTLLGICGSNGHQLTRCPVLPRQAVPA